MARGCFSCEALFDPRLLPLLEALLATKIRYHEYFLKQYGRQNVIVHSFERILNECKIQRTTILSWGRAIQNDVEQKNISNLAAATGYTSNPSEELANVKDQLALLTNKLDEHNGTVAKLMEVVSRQSTMIATLVEQQTHSDVAGPCNVTPTNPFKRKSPHQVSLCDVEPNGLAIGKSAAEIVATLEEDHQLKQPADNQLDSKLPAVQKPPKKKKGVKTRHTLGEGLIPVASGVKLLGMSSVQFLTDLAQYNLDFKGKAGKVFYGGELNPSGKTRVAKTLQYYKNKAPKGVWEQYKEVGKQWFDALDEDLPPNAVTPIKEKVSFLAQQIVDSAKKAYLNEFMKSDDYKKAQKKQYVLDNAKVAVTKIGFGGRL